MTSNPVVTVGLTAHSEPASVMELAVKSVYAQTFSDWELVIALDGVSSDLDHLLNAIDDPRVRIIGDAENRGVGVRHNEITREARGQFIAKLDGDDVMHPDRLLRQIDFLAEKSDSTVLGTGAYIIDQANGIQGIRKPVKRHVAPQEALQSVPVTHPTSMASRSWFVQHPYDEELIRSQDLGLWLSSYNDTEFDNLPEPLLFYRVANPMTYDRFSRRYKYARIAMKKLGRNVASPQQIFKARTKTWIKQGGAKISILTGQQDALYQRLFNPISEEQTTQATKVLKEISQTRVPGWAESPESR